MTQKTLTVTPVLQWNMQTTAKIVINRGGTRSSKTVSLAQQAVQWMLTGKFRDTPLIYEEDVAVIREQGRKAGEPPEETEAEIRRLRKGILWDGTYRIFRKYQSNLSETAKIDLEWALEQAEAFGRVKINKQKMTYEFTDVRGGKKRVRRICLSGADSSQKLRGMKQDFAWGNEANELTKDDHRQISFRTRFVQVYDFNPSEEDVWLNVDLEQKRAIDIGDVEVIVSNYTHNPFLSPTQVATIEHMKKADPEFWLVYGMGEYGRISGLVLPHMEAVDAPQRGARFVGWGLDWGYTNDPTSVIGVYADPDGGITLDELIYETGLQNKAISDLLKENVVDPNDEITADSSEPKSVDELYSYGWNIEGAVKGKDSVNYGLSLMQERPLRVTKRSRNLRKEGKNYKYKRDKNDVILNDPVDLFNHGIDAARYCIMRNFSKVYEEKSIEEIADQVEDSGI